MSGHSIEELKRQYEAAKSREFHARKAADDARDRWYEALRAAKIAEFEAIGGVVGVTRVRCKGRFIEGPSMTNGPFVVMGAEMPYPLSDTVLFVLAKIKKDGTPSAAPSGVACEAVFILPEDQPK